MANPPAPGFSTDRPLSSKADDRLNRASFADRVAGVLRGLPNGTGLVIGLHGPWGDGKTTVLNMLRADLQEDDNVVVRDFNPWRLSDEESMLRGFLGMLAGAINRSLATKTEETKAAAAKWVKPFRCLTRPLGWFWKPAETADDLLAKIGQIAASGDTVALDELRDRIERHLRASGKRIVVLVDDIDRLDKHETHTLFRLIKACADFPNVCYVLAFDDEAVAKSLGERYGGGDEAAGRAFLEKIVQVSLHLPLAMPEDLRALCFEQVNRANEAASIDLSEGQVEHFVSSFSRGIAPCVNTPRAAKLYGNALLFTLPLVKDEVSVVDMLLVEAMRVFYPSVYSCIRQNLSEFAGVEFQSGVRPQGDPVCAELLKPILKQLAESEREAAKNLVKGLFPRVAPGFGGPRHGNESLSGWAAAKRACSPEYADRYFTYAVAKGDVRESEIDRLCELAGGRDSDAVRLGLESLFREVKSVRVIERLSQRAGDMEPNAAEVLALMVAALGRDLPVVSAFLSDNEAHMQAGILISKLIDRLPAGAARTDCASRVMETAEPLWFGRECLRWLRVSEEPVGANNNTLTAAERVAVRAVLVRRLKDAIARGEPLVDIKTPQNKSLLFEWWRAEGTAPVEAYLLDLFARNPAALGDFLQSMAPQVRTLGQPGASVGELDTMQLKNIKVLIGLDHVATLIRKDLPGNFDDPKWDPLPGTPLVQVLAEQFMYVYNRWKREGEPPDQK